MAHKKNRKLSGAILTGAFIAPAVMSAAQQNVVSADLGNLLGGDFLTLKNTQALLKGIWATPVGKIVLTVIGVSLLVVGGKKFYNKLTSKKSKNSNDILKKVKDKNKKAREKAERLKKSITDCIGEKGLSITTVDVPNIGVSLNLSAEKRFLNILLHNDGSLSYAVDKNEETKVENIQDLITAIDKFFEENKIPYKVKENEADNNNIVQETLANQAANLKFEIIEKEKKEDNNNINEINNDKKDDKDKDKNINIINEIKKEDENININNTNNEDENNINDKENTTEEKNENNNIININKINNIDNGNNNNNIIINEIKKENEEKNENKDDIKDNNDKKDDKDKDKNINIINENEIIDNKDKDNNINEIKKENEEKNENKDNKDDNKNINNENNEKDKSEKNKKNENIDHEEKELSPQEQIEDALKNLTDEHINEKIKLYGLTCENDVEDKWRKEYIEEVRNKINSKEVVEELIKNEVEMSKEKATEAVDQKLDEIVRKESERIKLFNLVKQKIIDSKSKRNYEEMNDGDLTKILKEKFLSQNLEKIDKAVNFFLIDTQASLKKILGIFFQKADLHKHNFTLNFNPEKDEYLFTSNIGGISIHSKNIKEVIIEINKAFKEIYPDDKVSIDYAKDIEVKPKLKKNK